MDQKIKPLQANGGQQTAGRTQTSARQTTSNAGQSAGQTARTVGGTQPAPGETRAAASLHVGDVVRGEITDLRNNEISITLEDNTVLRAQINDSASYSIGQTGSFRLVDIAGKTLYLEHVAGGYTETEQTLITKALEEANLPATAHNEATVKALMDNMQPINRASIQALMQQSYDLQTEDMNTLALMNRLGMKADAESIAQFSSYRNDSYQLLSMVHEYADDIPSLLSALADNGSADAVADFGRELLSITLSEASETATPETIAGLSADAQADFVRLLSDTPLTEETISKLQDRSLSLQNAMTLVRDAAVSGTITLPEETDPAAFAAQINEINQALEPHAEQPAITEDFVKSVLVLKSDQTEEMQDSEPADLNDAAQEAEKEVQTNPSADTAAEDNEAAKSRFSFAGKFLHTLSESAKNTLSGTLDAFKSATVQQDATLHQKNPSLSTLIQAYESDARSRDTLNTYLTAGERQELLAHLEDFPISRSLLGKIPSGEASTREVLTAIYNTIHLSDSALAKQLFQSAGFEKLFARALRSAWTITPEQIAKGEVSDFYSRMHAQLGRFESMIQSSLSGSDSQELSQFAHDVQSNLSFLQTLSEAFSYFQLPLKLQNQDAHSDLYVFTQKEHLKNNPEKASVLLHLNLENLGEIDVRLERNRNDVTAKFYLNDTDAVRLFDTNRHMLKNALALLGYNCQVQVQEKEVPSPTVDDFINTKVNTRATAEMKRFSFDIRA